MNPNEVNSQESFLEFIAALQREFEAEKRRVDVYAFLEGMHSFLQTSAEVKKRFEPSWQTFAMLLRIGRSLS
jgi:hypothetical protein